MPNWCLNVLTIKVHPDMVESEVLLDPIVDLILAYKTEEKFLQHMRPMPDELKDTVAPNESGNNWYFWRVDNWGTKWEVQADIEWNEADRTFTATFDSAWAPPIEAVAYWAEKHPGFYVELSYWEPGMAFVGAWDSIGGDECYNYSEYSSDTVREHIPEYLVDYWTLEDELASLEELEKENAE